MVEVIGFGEFLVWLMAGGSAMASSFILERIPAFQLLGGEVKKFIAYLVAALMGVGAFALVTFAPEFILLAEPFFKIVAGIFISIFLSNAFHAYDKSGKG